MAATAANPVSQPAASGKTHGMIKAAHATLHRRFEIKSRFGFIMVWCCVFVMWSRCVTLQMSHGRAQP